MSSSDWKTSETLWCPPSSGLWSALLESFKPVTKGERKTEHILHINNVTFVVYITETLPRQEAVWGSFVCKWSNHHVKSCLLSSESRFQLASVCSSPFLLSGRLRENHTQLLRHVPGRWKKVAITHCSFQGSRVATVTSWDNVRSVALKTVKAFAESLGQSACLSNGYF